LSHLRESGDIEADADMVLMLHRPGQFSRDEDLKDTAELIVAKNRNGRVGEFELKWVPEFTTFRTPAPAYEYPPEWLP
jgi:replicative DNA helicase